MHQVKSKTRRCKLITIMFSSYKEKYQTSNTNVKRLISNNSYKVEFVKKLKQMMVKTILQFSLFILQICNQKFVF